MQLKIFMLKNKTIIDEYNIHQHIECLYNEKWKRISEFPNYLISNYGRCYSLCHNKLLKPQLNEYKANTPYYGYRLSNSIKTCWMKVHRLVATYFVANPFDKPEVYHINNKHWDNRASNLIWATAEERDEMYRMMREAKKLHKLYKANASTNDLI